MLGILCGVAYGDALGAPYERGLPVGKFGGRIEHAIRQRSRFHGYRNCVLGQVTDDTEMTLIVAQEPDIDLRTIAYMKWANGTFPPDGPAETWADRIPRCPFMGRTIREMFVGIGTLPGLCRRRDRLGGESMSYRRSSEANGALMRAAPLAAHPDWFTAAWADCEITHPAPVCVMANIAYVGAIRFLLDHPGSGVPEIVADIQAWMVRMIEHGGNSCAYSDWTVDEARAVPHEFGAVHDVLRSQRTILNRMFRTAYGQVARVIVDAVRMVDDRDVTDHGGWCLHAIWCAFRALAMIRGGVSAGAAFSWVVGLGGDTDTNGAIAGGLIGAHLGIRGLVDDPVVRAGLEIVVNARPKLGDIPRPDRLVPSAPVLAEAARMGERLRLGERGGGSSTPASDNVTTFRALVEDGAAGAAGAAGAGAAGAAGAAN